MDKVKGGTTLKKVLEFNSDEEEEINEQFETPPSP